jgi:ribonuclease P protein component
MPDERTRLRLPRAARLSREAEFRRVYREGSRARCELFTVAVAPNALGRTRLGLSVGKKAHRRAVARNRVRRVMREAFRLSMAELPVGVDVVVIASAPGVFPELEGARRLLVPMVAKALRRQREKARGGGGDGGEPAA